MQIEQLHNWEMVYLSLSYLEHVSLFFFYRIIVTILTCYNLYISLFISAIISTTQLEAVQWLHSDWRACNEIITEEDPAPCSWEYAKVNADSVEEDMHYKHVC